MNEEMVVSRVTSCSPGEWCDHCLLACGAEIIYAAPPGVRPMQFDEEDDENE